MSPRVGAYEVSSSTSSLSWPTPSPKIGATTPKWPAVVERRPFGDHARLAILSISVVCLTFMMANNSILYFTVLCMDAPAPAKDADGDKFQQPAKNNTATSLLMPHRMNTTTTTTIHTTTIKHSLELDHDVLLAVTAPTRSHKGDMFSSSEQSWLFCITSAGTILGALPFGHLVQRYGFSKIFVVYSVTCGLTTAILPFFARLGFYPLVVFLLAQGTTCSVMFVSMDSISSSWSPLSESGMFLSVISSCIQLGRVIAPPIAGAFCESRLGWPWTYYVLGAGQMLATVVFFQIYKDSPRQSRFVSPKEAALIEEGKLVSQLSRQGGGGGRNAKMPYGAMLTDSAIWAIYITCFGASLGNQIMVQYGPIYLHKALGYSIMNTGFVAALPYLIAIALKLSFGLLMDRMRFLTDKVRVVLYASVSQYVMALSYVGLVLLPKDQFLLLQVCFNGVISFAGLFNVGIVKHTQTIAGGYSSIVTASTTFMITAVKVYIPFSVYYLVPDQTVQQWNVIFIITAVTQTLTTSVFHAMSKSVLRPWAASVDDDDQQPSSASSSSSSSSAEVADEQSTHSPA